MRAIVLALPGLLLCGLVSAKEMPASSITRIDVTGTASPVAAKSWLSGEQLAARRPAKKASAAKKPPAPVEKKTAADSNRFNMTQNGKQMTADDFDKWMKAKGIRVAGGAPAAGSSGAAAPSK
ncbi:hypothetical protein [Lysobacter fragariae]